MSILFIWGYIEMSDFLDKLKGSIDKGFTTVNAKSKELIERQKIKLRLSELEAERKDVLLGLGKLTYLMVEQSGGTLPSATQKSAASTKSADTAPDKWEQVVLSTLGDICEEKLDGLLFENTDKDFKITAKVLSAEVQKSIPKSEQKGQNLQWLGRVLGKFGIASRKFSKRINGDRETVYEFNKQKTLSALNIVKQPIVDTDSKDKGSAYTEQIESKSADIAKLDTKIAKLEEQLSQIGT